MFHVEQMIYKEGMIMAPKKGLGRGLSTLIPTDEQQNTAAKTETIIKEKEVIKEVEVVKEVPADTILKISQIEPNKNQPREKFDEDALQELADSIKKYGIIQPITVIKKKDYYQIVAGERRYRAARLAGLKEIPVNIKEYTDNEIAEIALIENLQREDLNPIEEARAYQKLIDDYNLKQDEVAEKVSKSRSTITNSLRLLKLTNKVQEMLIEDMISSGHAKLLLSLEDETLQYETACKILDENLSVRETEKLIKKLQNAKTKKEKTEIAATVEHAYVYRDIEDRLKHILGSKIEIKAKDNKKGKIEISYFSQEELERITEMLYSINNEI